MAATLPPLLFIKSLLVRTPFEAAAKQLRWLLEAKKRRKHPELWELYLEDRRLCDVLQRLLANDSCGVDVGAHIGSFLSLLMTYAPKGRHVAFEPSTTKGKWLRSRFPDVQIFPYAVADKAGSAVFEEDCARPGYSYLRRETGGLTNGSSSYEVLTCRLDDILLEKDRVDLIKLDIEGGELAALLGAIKVIRRSRPAIIFECGSEYHLDQQNLSRRALYDFITGDLEYEIFCFVDLLFAKGKMTFEEFQKCGLYPFRAFNFVALPSQTRSAS